MQWLILISYPIEAIYSFGHNWLLFLSQNVFLLLAPRALYSHVFSSALAVPSLLLCWWLLISLTFQYPCGPGPSPGISSLFVSSLMIWGDCIAVTCWQLPHWHFKPRCLSGIQQPTWKIHLEKSHTLQTSNIKTELLLFLQTCSSYIFSIFW